MELLPKNWRNRPYKNTSFLIISLLVFFFFVKDSAIIHKIIEQLGATGYIGAFISGIFFVSVFTVAPTAVVLFELAGSMNPILVALAAGAGAMLGDYLIFRYFKDRVFEELMPIFKKLGDISLIKKIFFTPYFSFLLPLIGAIMVASPMPDEVGLAVMGASKIKPVPFFILTFLLNACGILLTVVLARSF